MKKYILFLFVISLIGVSCEKESATLMPAEDGITNTNTDPSGSEGTATLRGNQPRPFKGTIVYDTVADNGLSCNCSNGQKIQIEGSGTISHLGLSTSATTYCLVLGAGVNCPGPIPGALVSEACLTVVAANGDEVFLNVQTPYETCITACCFEASIQGTFDGGTGRFTDATGDWTASIVQELGSSISEVTVDGDIVY